MGVKNAIKVEVNYNYLRHVLLLIGIIGYITVMSLTVVVVENYHDNDNE